MGRNIGEGLSEVGSGLMEFGLKLLKEGIDENKRKEILKTYQEWSDYLDTLNLDPAEKEQALQTAQTSTLIGIHDSKEATTGNLIKDVNIQTPPGPALDTTPMSPIMSADVDAGVLTSPGNIIAEEKPGAMPTAAPAPTTPTKTPLQDIYSPYAAKTSRLDAAMKDPKTRALMDALVKRGADPTILYKAMLEKKAGIVEEGKQAVEMATKEKGFELTEQLYGIKRSDAESKRLAREESLRLKEEKQEYERQYKDFLKEHAGDKLGQEMAIADMKNEVAWANVAARNAMNEISAKNYDSKNYLSVLARMAPKTSDSMMQLMIIDATLNRADPDSEEFKTLTERRGLAVNQLGLSMKADKVKSEVFKKAADLMESDLSKMTTILGPGGGASKSGSWTKEKLMQYPTIDKLLIGLKAAVKSKSMTQAEANEVKEMWLKGHKTAAGQTGVITDEDLINSAIKP